MSLAAVSPRRSKKGSRRVYYLVAGALALAVLVAYDLSFSVKLDSYSDTTTSQLMTNVLESMWKSHNPTDGNVGEVLPSLEERKPTTTRKAGTSSSSRLADRRRNLKSTPAAPHGGHPHFATSSVVEPPKYTSDGVQDDPLRAENWSTPYQSIALTRSIPYVGTLLDAGRHYFPVDWIKRLLDRMADMQMNLLHFRLTDDQTFNVLLESHPALAYPTAVDNPNQLVYSIAGLKEIAAHAKSVGISIMPEVNVPGHAGAWAGIPDLVVSCPNFVCEKGYGLPINVLHPDMHSILADVLVELIQIFDPPFLHLGGDEVNMADPCFKEAGVRPFDYGAFEQQLKKTLKDRVGYPEEQVVRWEMTGQKQTERAGAIEQFWMTMPFSRKIPKSDVYFASGRLYFDTNGDQDAYDVYSTTRQYFNLQSPRSTTAVRPPTAIIAGTFELSSQFWFDRNVLGKLLAVVMGVAEEVTVNPSDRAGFNALHKGYCQQLGLGSVLCDKQGVGVILFKEFKAKWEDDWVVWRRDICERYAEDGGEVLFLPFEAQQEGAFQAGNEFFWSNFPAFGGNETLAIPEKAQGLDALSKHSVEYAGVLVDTTTSLVPAARLTEIVEKYVAPLGLNLIQFPLVNNHGFVYKGGAQADLAFSPLASTTNPVYDLYQDLRPLVEKAASLGIEFMPELHVSSNAGGWFKAGFVVDCPKHFCSGGSLVNDITNPLALAVFFSVISEVRQAFGSPWLHLGSHDRSISLACFDEAQKGAMDSAELSQYFHGFEHRLQALLDLGGIARDRVVRWNGPHDEDVRAGGVTQYAPGQEAAPGDSALLTVDILDGDGFAVYQRVLQMVESAPLGIVASLHSLTKDRWTELQVPQRLLAYAMGLSTLERINDATSFASTYESLCQSLSWQDAAGSCAPPDALTEEHDTSPIAESEAFIERHCALRTKKEKGKFVAKEIKPFYQDLIAES